jgi:hypothetical protein
MKDEKSRDEKLNEMATNWHKDATAPDHLRERIVPATRSGRGMTFGEKFKAGALLSFLPLMIAGSLYYRSINTLPPLETLTQQVLPVPNAHDTLRDAFKLRNITALKKGEQLYVAKNPLPLARRQEIVAQNQKLFQKIREALAQEYLQPMTYSLQEKNPGFANNRELARLLGLAAQTEAELKHYDRAAEYSTDAISLGVKMPRGGSVVNYLVGVACEQVGYVPLWNIADNLDTKTLKTIIKRLELLEKQRVPLADALKSEKTWCINLFRMLAYASPNTLKDLGFKDTSLAWRIYMTPKRAAYEANQRYMQENIDLSRQPFRKPIQYPPVPTDSINQIITPALMMNLFIQAQARTQNALLRTYLALRLYYLEKGTYPKTLGELVTNKYLATLPIDALGADQPLCYKKGEKGRFVLYSRGPDGEDNQGKPIDLLKGLTGAVLKEPRGMVETDTGDWVAGVH